VRRTAGTKMQYMSLHHGSWCSQHWIWPGIFLWVKVAVNSAQVTNWQIPAKSICYQATQWLIHWCCLCSSRLWLHHHPTSTE
jgi:hypothetical protein